MVVPLQKFAAKKAYYREAKVLLIPLSVRGEGEQAIIGWHRLNQSSSMKALGFHEEVGRPALKSVVNLVAETRLSVLESRAEKRILRREQAWLDPSASNPLASITDAFSDTAAVIPSNHPQKIDNRKFIWLDPVVKNDVVLKFGRKATSKRAMT